MIVGGHQYGRNRTLLLAAHLVLVAATLPAMARHAEVPWRWMALWLVGFTALTAASATRRFDRVVRRYGPVVIIAMIVALVAMTGGTASPYAALYLPAVGFLAAFRETRSFLVGLALAAAAQIGVALVDGDLQALTASVIVAIAAGLTFAVIHRVASDYRDTTQTYQTVVEHHAGPNCQLAPDGTFLSANSAALQVLGMRLEDVVGRPWADVVAPGEAERLRPTFVAAMEGQPQELTVTTDAPGGRYHLRGTVFPIRVRGRVAAVMGITWDLTEATEASFGAAALRAVVDRLATPVAIFDAQSRETLYSNGAARHLASRLDDAATLRWSELRDELVGDLPGVGETRTVRLESRGDDAEADWEATVHCLSDQRHLLAVTATDTSERAHRERALQGLLASEQEAADRLRSIDALKNSFLSATSHELRTPLTVILGTAMTLTQRRADLDAESRERLEDSLLRHAEALDRLLGDLLDVDHLMRGASRAQPSSFDVASTLRRLSRSVLGDEHVTVHAPEQLTSFADRVQIERIISNLLDNAAKYAPDAHVTTTLTPLPDGGFRLEVTDEGPGIPDDQLQRVFEPFHRVNLDDPRPGTGIGLALTAEFAAAHGGRAYAEAPAAGGVRMVVEIPSAGSWDGSAEPHRSSGPR